MSSSGEGANPWFLRGVPETGDYLLFGFPYAGVGASSYREWPSTVGTGGFCALQPPGRENRILEDVPATHDDFAARLAEALAVHTHRPYAFLGHCGAFPYMLQTVLRLQELGLPLPRRLFASSWGAPHRGLYGSLNFVDLDRVDMVSEVQRISGQMGRPLPRELAELAAETMLADLRVQRGYRYSGTPRVPVPVTVIGWSDDDVVPAEQVWDGWTECADASYHPLEGDHGAFLRCPESLRELVSGQMGVPGGQRSAAGTA
ncbi:thioesterase domain-containing protein [Nocardiopsis sp. ARC36]